MDQTRTGDTGAGTAVDGRRERRLRSRRAVIDAMIDLVLEGDGAPNVGDVAERAGVSQASLFRYFATVDDLRREAIGRYFERFDHLIAVPDIGEGVRVDRIDRFVAARGAFYEHTAPMARLVRRQVHDVTALSDTLDRLRSTLVDQVAQHFADDLADMGRSQRDQRVAVIASVTSFESWEQLANLGDRGRHTALVRALHDLTRPDQEGNR